MKILKDVFELLVAVLGIFARVFNGEYGAIVPLAFILQVVWQINCASLWLNLSFSCIIAVAFALCCCHLFIALLIVVQPLSELGPDPSCKNEQEFEQLASRISVFVGSALTLMVVSIAAGYSGSTFQAAFNTFTLSAFGAVFINKVGIIIPMILASRK